MASRSRIFISYRREDTVGSLGALMGDPVLAMGTLIPAMGATACLVHFLARHQAPAPFR